MTDFLAIIGASALFAVGIFTIYMIFCGVSNLIIKAKRNYQIKHRFDKPPTAACYCRDCKRHDNDTQRCYKFDGWHTADSWFCWDAEPRR